MVVQRKTPTTDGYDAVQLGLLEFIKPARINKPMTGHLKKAGVEGARFVREFRLRPGDNDFKPGDKVLVDEFKPNEKVDVIGVVPNDAEVLEPVLERARAAGIKVITHESPKQKNVDYDFELASAKGFGEAYGKRLVNESWELSLS